MAIDRVGQLRDFVGDDMLRVARSKFASETAGMSADEKRAFIKGLKFASVVATLPGIDEKSKAEMLGAMVLAGVESLD